MRLKEGKGEIEGPSLLKRLDKRWWLGPGWWKVSDFGCVMMVEPVGFNVTLDLSERRESRMIPKNLV